LPLDFSKKMLSRSARGVLDTALQEYRPGQSELIPVGGVAQLKPALRLNLILACIVGADAPRPARPTSPHADTFPLRRYASPLTPSPLESDAFNPRVIVWAETHDVRIFLQGVVNDPSIVGIHRLKFDRSPRNPDGVGDLTYTLPQFVISHGAPMADVDLHPLSTPVLGLENPVQKKLQVFQRFAVVTDQSVAFGRKNLELPARVGLDLLDVHDEAEVTKHGV
jgi:hypothetical protein